MSGIINIKTLLLRVHLLCLILKLKLLTNPLFLNTEASMGYPTEKGERHLLSALNKKLVKLYMPEISCLALRLVLKLLFPGPFFSSLSDFMTLIQGSALW